MARKKSDDRLQIANAFLTAWGEMMTQGWREKIGPLHCNLGDLRESFGFDTMANGGSITIEDIEIINTVVDGQREPTRSCIHHYFRRDGIYKQTRTIKQVAQFLGYSSPDACRRDIESVELIVFGCLFPKLSKIRKLEPAPVIPATEPESEPEKTYHWPTLSLNKKE